MVRRRFAFLILMDSKTTGVMKPDLKKMSADEFEAEAEWILEAKAEGYTWKQLAEKYGVSVSYLRRVLKPKKS